MNQVGVVFGKRVRVCGGFVVAEKEDKKNDTLNHCRTLDGEEWVKVRDKRRQILKGHVSTRKLRDEKKIKSREKGHANLPPSYFHSVLLSVKRFLKL